MVYYYVCRNLKSMSFVNSIVKINKKSVYDMILDKQNEIKKSKSGKSTIPDVIEKLLEELLEIKKQK